jgi:hypothetical protein
LIPGVKSDNYGCSFTGIQNFMNDFLMLRILLWDKRIFLCFLIYSHMYSIFFRFVVTTLTILTANLLTNAIGNYLVSYKNHLKPVTFTLIGMLIIIVVFYPLFIKLEGWLKSFSVRVIRSGNSVAGKYLGLSLTFFGGMLVLLYFYTKIWYHIDIVQIVLKGDLGRYI